jgi:hypothetical protein
VNLGGAKRFFMSPKRPYWLGSPPSLIFSDYQGIFLGGGVKEARA